MEALFEGFGSMVFSEHEMQERLPRPVYEVWKNTRDDEAVLDRNTADAIAHAMKRWALEKGATHYTHWFQPLTGTTAEKHDSFLEPGKEGLPITHFSSKELIKGEPDASSFPNGGLRATFEARGYTYWDISSPAFIRDNVLCIPTVFVSYDGTTLDKKDPLLKSIKAINLAATRVANLLGDKDVKYCFPSVGLEQEYFLIDRKYFEARSDLKMTGRTLFGASAPKGQELGEHYFGTIPVRVNSFMKEVDKELWKLGIFAKTEHNEAAPGQFELAPVFAEANISVDQNHLIMDTLRSVAAKHKLACLLYEKPFEGINGSGKHNNYAIMTDDKQNLFAPGDKPAENIRFLVFICAFLKAVDKHPVLLRLSASCAGNDHRLGANEAPPAIISVYLGSYIEKILNDINNNQIATNEAPDSIKDFNPISGLSYVPHDNSDRNRTSPIAFTGNKFEFRMIGSSMNAAFANTVLNSILAETLNEIAEELSGLKYINDVRAKAMDICKQIIAEHKRIIFSGDGYSEEWVKEAKKRGLPNIKSWIEATPILTEKATVDLFTKLNVYTKKELLSRQAIHEEQYASVIRIEVKTLLQMTQKDILPAMTEQLRSYAEISSNLGNHTPKYVLNAVTNLSNLIDNIYSAHHNLETLYEEIFAMKNTYKMGCQIYDKVCPAMEELRKHIDAYEKIASKKYYKVPSYEDMLFGL